MKTPLCLILSVLLLFIGAPRSVAAKPAKQAPATQFDGTITTISDTSITVKGATGTKSFTIHPGTVFGQRAAKKLSDFKAGDNVRVVFTTDLGQLKAENIRNPDDDKKPGKKKAKAQAK
jgi:hypothetical protein